MKWAHPDEAICARLRTDSASFVLPETLCEFRSRIDEVLMDELIAIQAANGSRAGQSRPPRR